MKILGIKKKKKVFIVINDISNYSFKNKKKENFMLKKNNLFQKFDMSFQLKRHIGFIILVYFHKFPHILLIRNKSRNKLFCLPGGEVNVNYENIHILKNLLKKKLSIEGKKTISFMNMGKWIFPYSESRIKYPYLPPHLNSKKKELSLYLVELKNESNFEVNINWDLIAVPLFEINENNSKYGLIISQLPTLLFSFLFSNNKVVI